MSSRSWGPGTSAAGAAGTKTPGDGSPAGPGAAGEQPGSDRTGSARMLIGFASLLLTLLSLVLWVIFSRVWDGLALLTLIFAVTFVWSIGALRWSFYAS